MNCKMTRNNIYKWFDGELKADEQAQLESHLLSCPFCQKEVESLKGFHHLLKTSSESIEPSESFEARFWRKVYARRENEPWYIKLRREIESWVPVPNFAQVMTAVVIAFVVGSTSGIVATFNYQTFETPSSVSLSGSAEYQGIPSVSLAASYLKDLERRAA